MKKRERTFCLLVSQGKPIDKAAHLAGYKDSLAGASLIARDEITKEIIRILGNRKRLMKSLAYLGYEHLAFGNIDDCISLLSSEDISADRLKNMDLFMISEIKKPKDGAMEIKFFDRLKAMEKLYSSDEGQKECVPFYEALEKSAMALVNRDE